MIRPLLAVATPALLPAFLLAGCAVPDAASYPSLAPRPAEAHGFEEPAAPPPAPVVADPALDARIATAGRARAAAAAAFDRAAAQAERAARAARGAAAGSEPWMTAQTLLAELDSLRSAHADASGQLEDVAAERAQALQPAYPVLERALKEARAADAAQTARIDSIARMLPGA